MSLIIRGETVDNANQSFTVDFFCEDGIIHIDSPFYAPFYGAIEKRSAATAPFAVER
jgi:hypothetical protein